MKCANEYHWGGCCDHLSMGMEFFVVAATRKEDHDEIVLVPRGTPIEESVTARGLATGAIVARVPKGRYEFAFKEPSTPVRVLLASTKEPTE